MNTLIVYDSQHGHTEKVAFAIGEAIGARVEHAGKVSVADLMGHDLLIAGSPTHGGWYTEQLKALLDALPALKGGNVAVFDTRTATAWNRILPFGYAAPRIARKLKASGGKLVAPPEGFVVEGIEGPLKDGELERAARWAKGLVKR